MLKNVLGADHTNIHLLNKERLYNPGNREPRAAQLCLLQIVRHIHILTLDRLRVILALPQRLSVPPVVAEDALSAALSFYYCSVLWVVLLLTRLNAQWPLVQPFLRKHP